MSDKTIGIGIPVFNDHKLLLRYCLESIFFHTDQRLFKIAVLDDGSSRDNKDLTRRLCNHLHIDYLNHETNLGVAKSWNDLVNHLDTDYVILLNNDTIMFSKWFESLKYALTHNNAVVCLPSLIVNIDDLPAISRRPDQRCVQIRDPLTRRIRYETFNLNETGFPSRVMCPLGYCFGFPREMFDLVGGFDERYHCFYEEVDFGISLYKCGIPTIILPSPHIYHVWGATFQQNSNIESHRDLAISRHKFVEKWIGSPITLFYNMSHDFETKVHFMKEDGTFEVSSISETYPPDTKIEW